MVHNAVASATATSGRELAELRGQVQGLTESMRSAPAPTQLSAAEVTAKVNNGEMTETEAQTLLMNQQLGDFKRDIVQEVRQATADERRTALVQGQIEAYKTKIPNVMVDGSPERARVVTEYNYLVSSLGHKPNNDTELLAMRAVYGSAESIAAKANGTPEHHQESSGSGGGDENQGGSSTDGAPAHLSPAEKTYYADMIQKGMYPDWKAVSAELAFSNTNLRKRNGAR